MASLKNNNVCTLLLATSFPAGNKIIGSRWVYKVEADKSHNGRVVVQDGGNFPGLVAEARSIPSAGAPEHPCGAGNSGGVQYGALAAR